MLLSSLIEFGRHCHGRKGERWVAERLPKSLGEVTPPSHPQFPKAKNSSASSFSGKEKGVVLGALGITGAQPKEFVGQLTQIRRVFHLRPPI